MPSYTVNDGYRAILAGKAVQGGDKVTLEAEQGDRLVESGMLTPVKRGRPPAGKRSAWTPSDDEDDQEG